MYTVNTNAPAGILLPESMRGRFGDDLSGLAALVPVSYTHLAEFEADDVAPIYASWDLGLSDFMAIWLWQVIGGKRCV